MGSAGAINVVLKSMLDPGDEVIVLVPFFPEYRFYIENHGGRMVLVETDAHFQPDIERIAAALTARTKAIILNSPNNPTGAVYPAAFLRDLESLAFRALDHPVMVIADEPYRSLAFDGLEAARSSGLGAATRSWPYSWSKALAIPGERIGYLALSPRLAGARTPAQRLHVRQPHPGLHQCARHLAAVMMEVARSRDRSAPLPGETRPALGER